jgi:hypothetical protein
MPWGKWILVIIVIAAATLLIPPGAQAYSLVNPTPKDQMRPMTIDRPNITNSPQTVNSGHFQIEMGLVSYAYSGRSVDGNPHTSNLELGNTTVKVGVFDFLDFEVYLESYVHNEADDSVQTVRQGFGDIFLLTKVNFLGNDHGHLALALLPSIKVPSNQNGVGNKKYEGGGALLANYVVTELWSVGGEAQFNLVQRENGGGRGMQYIDSVSLNYDPFGPLEIFGEVYTIVEQEAGVPWTATADAGVLIHAIPNITIDADVGVGLNRAAETVNFTTGISFRF